MNTNHTIAVSTRFSVLEKEMSSVMQVVGASLLIALCAQISIPLFFSPVPLSLQTMAVMLVGAFLGGKKGAAGVMLYILEGAIGLPFFAKGGSGLLYLMGPTGGYLIGMVLQAYLAGWFTEDRKKRSPGSIAVFMCFSTLVQMSCGVLWLASYVGWEHVLIAGFYPFIPGEVLKSLFMEKMWSKANP